MVSTRLEEEGFLFFVFFFYGGFKKLEKKQDIGRGEWEAENWGAGRVKSFEISSSLASNLCIRTLIAS
jgi:hypothetical protein